MKNYALLLLAGLTLSACGSAPGQVSGGKVSIGVSAADAESTVTVNRTFTPETVDDTGKVTPAKEEFTTTEPGAVNFTFMTRPGSDAVYITGWRITRYNYNGQERATSGDINKLDIYVPSGYTCPERETTLPRYQSCQQYTPDLKQRPEVQPANGLPIGGPSLNFAGDLVSEVKRTLAGASSNLDLEFYGQSSNGAPVSVTATNISSRAFKTGN
ncbi:hypothetical protein [Deinococcus frigens]|uniref:hypothetical protein n=1 Tax=Deinococcus frigens TaxID=249403 RepID=UPI000496905D|nr:hypothetical protein [Deinococcus frigens]